MKLFVDEVRTILEVAFQRSVDIGITGFSQELVEEIIQEADRRQHHSLATAISQLTELTRLANQSWEKAWKPGDLQVWKVSICFENEAKDDEVDAYRFRAEKSSEPKLQVEAETASALLIAVSELVNHKN